MDEFVKLARKWSSDSIAKAKALAEAMAPVMETIGKAVEVLSGLSGFIPAAELSIKEFFANLSSVITKFGQLAEQVPNELERHAKRFAKRMDPVVGVLSPFIDGLTKLFDIKPVTDETLATFAANLKTLVVKFGQMADELDLSMVKSAQRLADHLGSIVGVLKDGVDGLTALKDLAMVPSAAFDAFFAGLKTALERMNDLAGTISTDLLGRAEVVAQKATSIFSAIKAGVEAFTALKDYQAIPQEAIANLLSDFQRALDLLSTLIDSAVKFESMAKSFQDHITAGAQSLTAAVTTFGQAFRDAAFTMQSAVWGQGTGVVRPVAPPPPGSDFSSQSVRAGSTSQEIHLHMGDVQIADGQKAELALSLYQDMYRKLGIYFPRWVTMG